jgi:threonine dehydrogenase-like Zn-dependent dehydrogenase
MRALVLRGGEVRFDARYPDPEPPAGEVLVRVTRAGVCETDLQLVRGYMGFSGVLGHEFVGVAESGPLAGERVVGEINCACTVCEACRAGLRNHCPNRTVLGILGRDGAFADSVSLPLENLHRVPDEVANEEAAFVEPLAAAYRVIEQVAVATGTKAVVVGDGRLGNLCAQVLHACGANVLAVGKHDAKLRLLAERGVAVAQVEEVTADLDAGRFARADLVVEATGSATGLPLALRLVRPRGIVVLKTTVAGSHALSLAPVVIDEVTLIGSRCGPFAAALRALAEGWIDVRSLISAERPLDDAVAALAQAAEPGMMKVQLVV